MPALNSILGSRYLLWMILALPSIPMILGVSSGNTTPHDLLHPTGEFAARFMIIAMLATPLRLLFQTRKWPAWLVRNRRYFGVAAFAYALLHTILYVMDSETLRAMLDNFSQLGIWTGWIAFLIFIPMALTSNDAAVKALRQKWKLLQRWIYPAAVLTLMHWIFVENNIGPALVHFVPLTAFEIYRVWHQRFRKKERLAR